MAYSPTDAGGREVSSLVNSKAPSEPVGVVSYGYDEDVSYGYPAGLALTVQP